MIRKMLLGSALLGCRGGGLYVRFHHSTPPLETAYAGGRIVTLYSTSAQVREPVATVSFGDRLEVLQRFQNQVKVRTAAGDVGWIGERFVVRGHVGNIEGLGNKVGHYARRGARPHQGSQQSAYRTGA